VSDGILSNTQWSARDIPGQDCGHAEDERRQGVQEAGHIIFLSDRDIERSESAALLRDEVHSSFCIFVCLLVSNL
jgi:hypothetical protein